MSDHGDAPRARAHPPCDIGDMFAFAGGTGLTLIMSVNPLTCPDVAWSAELDPECVYEFKIDLDGDAVPDLAYRVVAAGTGPRQQITLLRAEGEEAARFDRSGTVVATGWSSLGADVEVAFGGGDERLYVGPRQDPFFFDFTSLYGPVADLLRDSLGHDFPAEPVGTSEHTFRCTNITAIAVEVPVDFTTCGVWGVTTRQGHRIDRNGRPSITAIFLADDDEADDAFNDTDPADDRDRWGERFRRRLVDFDADPGLVDQYLPDILPVDLSRPTVYPNGRGLVEDPVTAQIFTINPDTRGNRGPAHNPIVFAPDFPYLTPPVGSRPGWTEYRCPQPLPAGMCSAATVATSSTSDL